MKKTIKFTALILCVVAVATLFCGCNSLDTRKKNQAFWNNKSRTEIILDGKIYKKLNANDYFSPETNSETGMFVTEKDVPVLLAGGFAFGDKYFVDENKELLCVNNVWYAESDVYEKYEKLMKNCTLDCLATMIAVKGEDGNYYTDKLTILTDEESDTIREAVSAAVDAAMPEDDYIQDNMDIFLTDKNLMFSKQEYCLYYYEKSNTLQVLKEDKYFNITPEYCDKVRSIMKKYASSKEIAIEY